MIVSMEFSNVWKDGLYIFFDQMRLAKKKNMQLLLHDAYSRKYLNLRYLNRATVDIC